MFKKLNNKFHAGQGALATVLMLSPLAAFATSTGPADEVVTKVQGAGADGIKVAVAVVLAFWGITAVYMLRRRS